MLKLLIIEYINILIFMFFIFYYLLNLFLKNVKKKMFLIFENNIYNLNRFYEKKIKRITIENGS